ncbi:MAG: hypothetical protein RL653_828 [Pseudomonadota bacterium]
MQRLASISVDLDSLPHYCRIHGLPESELSGRALGLVHAEAVPRFVSAFREVAVSGTFFAIGEDVALPGATEALRSAAAAGVEVASHSFAHDYALSRRPAAEVAEDLRRSVEVLEAAVGARPRGFRAPGYTLSATLYQAVVDAGFRYDSSTFPAAPYYLAKAGVMGALQLMGRPSRSVLDSPRVLTAPLEPYRPDPARPYARGAGAVVELPVAVSPVLRVPFIGTLAVAAPWAVVKRVYGSLRRVQHLNFELHAVDLLGVEDGFPPELRRQQRDLSAPREEKRQRLLEVFSWLRRDFDVVTLGEAAEVLGARL